MRPEVRWSVVLVGVAALFAGPLPTAPAAEDPPAAPAPDAAPPSRAAIDAAIARGRDFLLGARRPDGGWISQEYASGSPGHMVAITAVAMDALLVDPPEPETLAAVRRAFAFLETHAPTLDDGAVHHGFDFTVWGSAYGLAHLAGVRDRWPAGADPLPLAKLVDAFAAEAKRTQRPTGGWTYLTAEIDEAAARDGSVSFLTGVMVEGLRAWAREPEVVDRALVDLRRMSEPGGLWRYSHRGEYESQAITKEEAAGRSVQCAWTMVAAGVVEPPVLEGLLATFLDVRGEYVKTRTQHPHTPPFMIAGYYYHHAHYYAARSLVTLARDHPGADAVRDARVAVIARTMLDDQSDDGSWMDAPCGGKPYGTALAMLTLATLRDLLFPWEPDLAGALARSRDDGRPVLVIILDDRDRSRDVGRLIEDESLADLRGDFRWVRLDREADAAAIREASLPRGAPLVLVLDAASGFDPKKPALKLTGAPSEKMLRRKLEGVLERDTAD